MKGDFSRKTFNEVKNYSGVLKQQGRVSLDADANELIEILAHQRRVRTLDVIGTCCAPLKAGGFEIRHPGDSLADLLISTGRIYVGGLLCELHPGTNIPVTFPAGTTDKVQVKELKIEGQEIKKDQWVIIFTEQEPKGILTRIKAINTTRKILTLSKDVSGLRSGTTPQLQRMILYSKQPDLLNPPTVRPKEEGNTDLIYLDVWERHITAIEDPELREVALGGPDTTTRVKTVCQIKIKNDVSNFKCDDDIILASAHFAPSGGRLKTQTKPGTDPEDPCLIAEGGGYKGLENRLYRIEIHNGGDIGTATFKWSRDNGSIAYEIQNFIKESGQVTKIRLKQRGRDEILRIKRNDWLEISGEATDLNVDIAGTIVQVMNVDEAQRILTLDKDVIDHENEILAKVRRWDTGIDAQPPTKVTEGEAINLEDGIQIEFSGNNFKVGDYWTFAARNATGKIEELDDEPPHGIKHYYCKLALVKWNNDGTTEIKDCRHEFPSLCEVPRIGGCCTVTVGEQGDYETIQEGVDALNGGPGNVCVLPGIYEIEEPITIQGRDITISGCGGTSLILSWVDSSEYGALFRIEDSRGITISGLWGVTMKGDKAIVSVNSNFVKIKDCLMVAAGRSDNPGTIVFQGQSLGSELTDNIIAGIVGVRYDSMPDNNINIHAASRIEQNAIFALQNAIHQSDNAPLIGFNVVDNLLLGFSSNTMAKSYFPAKFLEFAVKKEIYSRASINKTKAVRKEETAFESATPSNTAPVTNFVNHLKVEATATRIKVEKIRVEEVSTAAPVINLLSSAIDANFLNNVILGKTGIHGSTLIESSIERNIIAATETGISLEIFEGVTVDNNLISAGGSGLLCRGTISFNLTVSNNRFLSGTHGIEFRVQQGDPFHLVANAQISQNFITASKRGIDINNPAIWIYDFSAFDNSITGCSEYGIILLGLDKFRLLPGDITSYQRVIQRNSVQVKGTGIVVGVADAKILDNDITIRYSSANKTDFSYGIVIFTENCTVINNSIQGVIDKKNSIHSKGGIIIYLLMQDRRALGHKKIIIRANRITGGAENGIVIADDTDIDDLIIESNLITNMGLNGIAVGPNVLNTSKLSILNNKISHCNRLAGNGAKWWKYAGIVLRSGENIQIIGNQIFENGNDIVNSDLFVGGIYAEQVKNIIISNNQLINNGFQSDNNFSRQAVIHIPADPDAGNEDVKVVDNIVKGSRAPALFLGGKYVCYQFIWRICFGRDNKTVITSNHFESLITGPAVELQSNRCIFSNNYIECLDSKGVDAVDLGYGWFVSAIGNVSSAPISGAGGLLEIEHNQLY